MELDSKRYSRMEEDGEQHKDTEAVGVANDQCTMGEETRCNDITVIDSNSTPFRTAPLKHCLKAPSGPLAYLITTVCLGALLFGVVWSIAEKECYPGGNLFGIIILFLCAVCGGKLVRLIQLPTLPPFPPLLGMLPAGFILINVPFVTDAVSVHIEQTWSAALRNIALAIILTRAGLGLNPSALHRLKAVCVRLWVEASTVAVMSHFLMGLPWVWGFILGFVLSAVSPAVVVPSMLLLQKDGYGVEKGIPTLLMAAGSFDDILAITGFTTCLGVAFASGSSWYNLGRGVLEVGGGTIIGIILGFFLRFFPSRDQEDVVLRRSAMLLGLSVFAVFGSRVAGFPGAGGLCTLVMAFLAALGWGAEKGPVAAVVGNFWDIFQPLLFGLIGAEITVSTLNPNTVGLGLVCISAGLLVRVLVTLSVVLFAGFTLREKLFIALAWIPKATVQAAIGSTALDMARVEGDEVLVKYGLDVLTVAVLAILTTAPIGALGIGLAGPRLLTRHPEGTHVDRKEGTEEDAPESVSGPVSKGVEPCESKM
ncbi:sodium/hydrogen exchanger 9B2-like [Oncorhynchus tshawytscha]|uniref:sodium/hydrogen exchanger 9B2-like n=1 Tax=Oncorhynchus tshawytscha TaxID=74940 RepID=UPI001C3DB552|nr:sodium/hydrogen exchanger 9B2-like [Oncorhynchus tshawytscha]